MTQVDKQLLIFDIMKSFTRNLLIINTNKNFTNDSLSGSELSFCRAEKFSHIFI
jgi:hypothetical protein